MQPSEMKIQVAVVGAGGYGGVGAIELLIRHPMAHIARLITPSDVGRKASDLFPHLAGFCDLTITAPDDPRRFDHADIVLFSTPDGVGQSEARAWLDHGVRVIDYSGDFRFSDPAAYAEYASRIKRNPQHADVGLLPETVYGVPELHRSEIAAARLVGNPGCFAIACTLGLAPAVARGLIDTSRIICDCKSGVSGAGKKPAAQFHYPARYESVNAYKIGGHQHVWEIERELSVLAKKEIRITFTPHVIPATRGILATLYAPLAVSPAELLEGFRAHYKDEPFVRVLGPEAAPSTSDVRESNFINIWINHDPRTGQAVIVSHIDNLMKGQAGNAIQSMNIMMGVAETTGLHFPGQYP